MIKPTVGRVLYYYPYQFLSTPNKNPPRAAIIAAVNEDGTLNIAWFDENGSPNRDSHVHLVQEGDETPHHPHCMWMPYQTAVAKGEIPPVQHAT